MTDCFTRKKRSEVMSAIKSQKTRPENILKKSLRGNGFSFQPGLYGKPDFADKKRRIAVFIDGCFWHKCSKHYREPKSNKRYWREKIERNVSRSKEVTKRLKEEGWKVIRIWEHDVENNLDRTLKKLLIS